MNLYEALDLNGADGRPSHSKLWSTVGLVAGWTFMFFRCHELTTTWTFFAALLFGAPYGIQGLKLALASRSTDDPAAS